MALGRRAFVAARPSSPVAELDGCNEHADAEADEVDVEDGVEGGDVEGDKSDDEAANDTEDVADMLLSGFAFAAASASSSRLDWSFSAAAIVVVVVAGACGSLLTLV